MPTADSVFSIGTDHRVCQDHAYHGQTDRLTYAIVSDGCSSARDSHIGAMFMSMAAAQAMLQQSESVDLQTVVYHASDIANNAVAMFGIGDGYCPEATLVAAVWEKDLVKAIICGDGLVVFRRVDQLGFMCITRNYDTNSPLYPVYLRGERWHRYCRVNGNAKVKTTFTTYGPDFSVVSSITEEADATTNLFTMMEVSASEYDTVWVMSDGAQSFTDAENKPADMKEVLQRLTTIPNWNGEFQRRRVWRMAAQKSLIHHDDLAVAAIHQS